MTALTAMPSLSIIVAISCECAQFIVKDTTPVLLGALPNTLTPSIESNNDVP